MYVDRGEKLDDTERLNLEGHLRLAEDLGARVIRTEGKNIADALAECARAEHATQVVMGHSARSRWQVLTQGSVINRLIDRLPETDIHIIAEPPEPRT